MYKTTKLFVIGFLCVLSFSSCSKDSIETDEKNLRTSTELIDNFQYSEIEKEILTAVNDYRMSKGLSILNKVDDITIQAEQHTQYMIEKNVVNHDNFNLRYKVLVDEIGAKSVSENVGYGYGTAQGVVAAWIKSEGHRENIEGDFTHFGISVGQNADGRNYFTNIFVKR